MDAASPPRFVDLPLEPGRVVGLFTAVRAGEPMRGHDRVDVVAGAGIDGDRYATRTGLYSTKHHDDRHLTLIEAETLAALSRDHDIDLPAQLCRRNVVVEGIGLNRLVGRHLRLGAVVVRVGRLNRPCHYLEKLTGLPVYEPLLHRSGVNCQVLRGGPLSLGDEVREVAQEPHSQEAHSEGIVTSVS